MGFYEQRFDPHGFPTGRELVYHLEFSHVPTCDFNGDSWVGFSDFAILAPYWHESNCGDSGGCRGADLNNDGSVDAIDLMLFADFWLETAECSILLPDSLH